MSIAYYFCQIFNVEIPVSVTKLPSEKIMQYLPFNYDDTIRKLRDMWLVVFDKTCFLTYLKDVLLSLNNVSMFILLFLPVFIMLPILVKRLLLTPNDAEHGEKSRSVVFCENKLIPLFKKIKEQICDIFARLWDKKIYRIPFVIFWLVNFNVITLIGEFLAYYFYFAFSFDLVNLVSIQVVKLLLDVVIMLSSAPLIFWLVVVYLIICAWRKKIGFSRLNFREGLDRAFMKGLSLLLYFTGTVGTGKTTAVTSFGISDEIRFRNKAFEMLMDIDSLYPNFPWINLEDELKRAISYRQILNLTQCRSFIEKKKRRFCNNVCRSKIFGYDIDTYRYTFNDNLTCKDIWEDLSDYACLYYIYIIQSSLILANISVRSDNELQDLGNFPLWDTELFHNTPEESARRTRRAHILDYDVLRLGRQILEENPRRGSFEFGVILLSEFAKERGNKITNEGLKKNDEKTNQRNDLLGHGLKMARHKATIRGFPFIRVIADDQRATSLEADTRELMSIVHIEKKNPTELLMPMYFVEELIHDIFYPRFVEFYSQYRFVRGDTCLIVYILHNVMSALHNHYKRMYNLFGCNVLDIAVQDGKMETAAQKAKIHILHKKVYSDRFATDCYNGFFSPELEESQISFDEYPEYADTVASREELHFQNSYFVSDLENVSKKSENKGDKNEKN